MTLHVTVTQGVQAPPQIGASPSFSRKDLRITFVLGSGRTFANGTNTLQVSGLRTVANVRSASTLFPQADIQIYGMLQSDMNSLISLQSNLDGVTQTGGFTRNSVTLEANSGNGWTTFFSGQIGSAGPDYSALPDVCLRLFAQALLLQQMTPVPPSSYTGPTAVSQIVSDLSGVMGCSFENNGVTAQVSNPYLPNTAAKQLKSICEHSNTDFYIDNNSVIAIAPKGSPRALPIWTLSPKTGLVGWPSRDDRGYVNARTLFNPAYVSGGLINIADSGLANIPGRVDLNVDGQWLIGPVAHLIEAYKPDGAWFSDLLLYPPHQPDGSATVPPS